MQRLLCLFCLLALHTFFGGGWSPIHHHHHHQFITNSPNSPPSHPSILHQFTINSPPPPHPSIPHQSTTLASHHHHDLARAEIG
jgi:hypothetical protein